MSERSTDRRFIPVEEAADQEMQRINLCADLHPLPAEILQFGNEPALFGEMVRECAEGRIAVAPWRQFE